MDHSRSLRKFQAGKVVRLPFKASLYLVNGCLRILSQNGGDVLGQWIGIGLVKRTVQSTKCRVKERDELKAESVKS
jgi:hypothetical protein